MTAEEIAAIVKEAIKTELTPLQTEIARLREGASLSEAHAHVTATLATPKYSTLPLITRERIAPEIARMVKLTEAGAIDIAALNTAIEARAQQEALYLSQLSGRTLRLGESRAADDDADRDDASGDDAELTGIFASWGLSESAAKVAARGRL